MELDKVSCSVSVSSDTVRDDRNTRKISNKRACRATAGLTLLDLFDDQLMCVMTSLSRIALLSVSYSCQTLRKASECLKVKHSDLVDIKSGFHGLAAHDVVKTSSLSVLQWLRESGMPWDKRCTNAAASMGNLDMLKWLRSEDVHGYNVCPWGRDCIRTAARYGSADMVRWMLDNGGIYVVQISGDLRAELCADAAMGGKYQTIVYLYEKGICENWCFYKHIHPSQITESTLWFLKWAIETATQNKDRYVTLLHLVMVLDTSLRDSILNYMISKDIRDSNAYLHAVAMYGGAEHILHPPEMPGITDLSASFSFYHNTTDTTYENALVKCFERFAHRGLIDDIKLLERHIGMPKKESILQELVAHFPPHVSSWFEEKVGLDGLKNCKDAEAHAIVNGNIETIKWLASRGFVPSLRPFVLALKFQNIRTFWWLVVARSKIVYGGAGDASCCLEVPFSERDEVAAIYSNNWTALKWMRGEGIDWKTVDTSEFSEVAENDRWILDLPLHTRIEYTNKIEALQAAADLSHFMVDSQWGDKCETYIRNLEWLFKDVFGRCARLIEDPIQYVGVWDSLLATRSSSVISIAVRRLPWSPAVMDRAAAHGLDVFRYMTSTYGVYDAYKALKSAVKYDDYSIALEMLLVVPSYVLERDVGAELTLIAITNGNLDILKLLITYGTKMGDSAYDLACRKLRRNIAEYISTTTHTARLSS